MDIYKLIQQILFKFDAESVHNVATLILKLNPITLDVKNSPKIIDGITYKNPIGLAAGFDKDGILINHIHKLGFGFMEIGTITPRPQSGNVKPRLFRNVSEKSIINRMGFNNLGLSAIQKRLEKRSGDIRVIGNIGKGFDTPLEEAYKDYLDCFRGMRDLVDGFVLNLSSPNTNGLRGLMREDYLSRICLEIQNENKRGLIKPIYVKISPDLDERSLENLVGVLVDCGISGIVATNTLGVLGGGLSGRPISHSSLEMVRRIQSLGSGLTVIGSGGIMSVGDVKDRFDLGCDLVQIYTGLIYNGPFFIKRCLDILD